MKLFRYRKPSLKTMLGVTKSKKQFKSAVGITAVMKPLRAPTNIKRQVLRKVGWYSSVMKLVRNKKPPTFLGE